MKVLVVVDMQNDFIDGALSTPGRGRSSTECVRRAGADLRFAENRQKRRKLRMISHHLKNNGGARAPPAT